jgi:hypothetical protein
MPRGVAQIVIEIRRKPPDPFVPKDYNLLVRRIY